MIPQSPGALSARLATRFAHRALAHVAARGAVAPSGPGGPALKQAAVGRRKTPKSARWQPFRRRALSSYPAHLRALTALIPA